MWKTSIKKSYLKPKILEYYLNKNPKFILKHYCYNGSKLIFWGPPIDLLREITCWAYVIQHLYAHLHFYLESPFEKKEWLFLWLSESGLHKHLQKVRKNIIVGFCSRSDVILFMGKLFFLLSSLQKWDFVSEHWFLYLNYCLFRKQ